MNLPSTWLTASVIARVVSQTRKNAPMASLLGTLSPQPVFSPPPAPGKENVSTAPSGHGKTARTTRKPLGPRVHTPPTSPTASISGKENAVSPAKKDREARRSRVFKDVTAVSRGVENKNKNSEVLTPQRPAKTPESRSNSVRDRMKAWERDRERLREMDQLEERVREVEDEREKQKLEEREMEEEVERERRRDCEQQEQEQRRQAELEVERQRELDLAREKVFEREGRTRQRERESSLPRLSLLRGASLTPPDSVPPTPLSPLKEGKHRSMCANTDMLIDSPRRI